MAVKSITVTELKHACLDPKWRKDCIEGKNPPTPLMFSPSSIAVYGTRFHRIVKNFVEWLSSPTNKDAAFDLGCEYSIWDKMYYMFAENEITDILRINKVESALYLANALKAFCQHIAKLRNKTDNFNTWDNIFLTNEYHIKDIQFKNGNNSLFISGQLDTIRVHPVRGIEIVDYKLAKIRNRDLDLLQLAIYAELLKQVKPQLKFSGTLEYYVPELNKVVVTIKQLNRIFDNMVVPVINELINVKSTVPGAACSVNAEPPLGKSLKKAKQTEISTSGDIAATDMSKEIQDTVHWKDVVCEIPNDKPLSFPIGMSADNKVILGNFAAPNMCHALVTGAACSGKSEFLKSLIASLIKNNTPDTLQLTIIDSKVLTYASFFHLPFFTGPVITDNPNALNCLEYAVIEMEKRYKQLSTEGYNDLSIRIRDGKNDIPFHVIIFDEFADIMQQGKKEKDQFERIVSRLGAKGRGTGIHLALATQRLDKDIVTGRIKASLSLKICMKVASSTNSSIVLDNTGAELLTGKGDLLCNRGYGIERAQSPFVSNGDLEAIGYTTVFV